MNFQSMQAFNDGMSGLRAGLGDLRESKLRKEMLKRQLSQDTQAEEDRAFDRTMKTKHIELAERGERNTDKARTMAAVDAQTRGASEDVQREIENLRRGQETGARVDLMKAQAAAMAAKPAQPPSPEEVKMQGWMKMRGQAVQQLQAAQASGDPAAIAMAQEDYKFVNDMRQGWLKQQKEPMVELEFPGEDGVSKMKTSVPQSQWNEKHALFGKFGGTKPPAPAPAALTQQQVLEQVRDGKMTKEQALAIGQKSGW